VTLDKQLPVAAGIGGGSADAAAVIRAVRRANPDRANAVDWKCVAASIGADVPVCLVPNLSWMRGVGEIVAPLGLDESVWVDALIVNPLEPVPEDKTAQVFRAYAASPNPYSWRDEDHPTIKRREDLLHAIRHGWNDLQIPAFKTMPNAQQILHEMGKVMQPGGLTGRMSGAGPTMFAIFDGAANATAAADALRRLQPRWWVQAVRLT
jgi:4-diphosphocytidyl-2-C-methyl-D-erythritol kinase